MAPGKMGAAGANLCIRGARLGKAKSLKQCDKLYKYGNV